MQCFWNFKVNFYLLLNKYNLQSLKCVVYYLFFSVTANYNLSIHHIVYFTYFLSQNIYIYSKSLRSNMREWDRVATTHMDYILTDISRIHVYNTHINIYHVEWCISSHFFVITWNKKIVSFLFFEFYILIGVIKMLFLFHKQQFHL